MPDAPPPPGPKRGLTTAIAVTLLCLGLLGLLLSGVGLASLLAGDEMSFAITRSQALTDAFLQALGKCGLMAMAVTMLMRHRSAVKAACAGLAISAMSSLYTIAVVIPVQSAAAEVRQVYVFFGCAVSIFSLFLYIGPILYLRTAASRKEFSAG